LPPEAPDPDRRGSPSPSPAKWMYPEEFKKREPKVARRSPSYQPFQRELRSSSSSSSSSSSDTGQIQVPRGKGGPRRQTRRSRERSSSSVSERPSPVYEPEEKSRPAKRKERGATSARQVSSSPSEDGRPRERLSDILGRLQWASVLSESVPREPAPAVQVEESEEEVEEVEDEPQEMEELQEVQEEPQDVEEVQEEVPKAPEEPLSEKRSESPPTWVPMTPPEEDRVGCWISTEIDNPGQGRPVRLRTPSPEVERKGQAAGQPSLPSQEQTAPAQPETVELVT